MKDLEEFINLQLKINNELIKKYKELENCLKTFIITILIFSIGITFSIITLSIKLRLLKEL